MLATATGCTAPHSGGGPVAPCALALPTARAAVHDHGRLLQVKTQKTRRAKHLLGVLHITYQRECVIIFRGPYATGEVRGAVGRGRYAIVVVRVHPPKLLHASLTNTLPHSRRKQR
jgi:hypothetical protein